MTRKSLSALLLILFATVVHAQLKSPEDFLGYKIGTRFTPHFKVINYFNHVAANSSIKLEKYGETNEGRPLMVAIVSSPENIQRIEQIRMNNLRLANLATDKAAAVEENAPAIVWLSYNVHGNEPSSSEASMLTLYALTDPSNAKAKEWLKNTVVIIDPCINPDGRDRYVNWYNTAVGKNYNPQPLAREHREPWPQGRTNHYNFDLNRDWAWQTQVESQYRIKKYDQWMPQVHVDYHEQGFNEPYYFAPAAEPFHEVITPWQREFQGIIGKNNAKYFDQNGWLYFTREVFDLFYPSYGDTYPLYNGAIGMTYEQGGIAGGLGVVNDEKDTLTLGDRAMHHFTTSMSTVEVASLNAGRLIKEYRKFFNNAVAGNIGEYKTFVIKDRPADAQRIKKLFELLDQNGIQYELAAAGTAKGYNYQTGKEESFAVSANDYIISTSQPRAALTSVLFEPRSKLSDSVTYDITAWAMPYVYGLTAYASKDKLPSRGAFATPVMGANPETNYGYIISWDGVRTVKAVAQLLKKGILLRYAEQPFEMNGQKFDRGAVIVLKTANKSAGKNLWTIVRETADANAIKLYPVTSGMVDRGFDFGSDKVHPVKAPRIVMATGDAISTTAAGGLWHFFENEIDYPVTQVLVTDLERLNWNDVDVLIMPDGNYRFLNNKEDLEAFKGWINRGGKVIAFENAVAQLTKLDIGLKAKKADDGDKKDSVYAALKNYADRERNAVSGGTPGSIWKVDLDNTHPLAFGYPNYYYTLKMDDNVYEFLKDGWNVGVIKKEKQLAGFVGTGIQSKLKDGLLFGVQNMGNGSIVYLADNTLFRSFWENGKLMFCNALFLVGQ